MMVIRQQIRSMVVNLKVYKRRWFQRVFVLQWEAMSQKNELTALSKEFGVSKIYVFAI